MDDVRKRGDHVRFPLAYLTITCSHYLHMKHGSRWVSVSASLVRGATLIALGILSGDTVVTRLSFIIAVTVVGSCVGANTTIHNAHRSR